MRNNDSKPAKRLNKRKSKVDDATKIYSSKKYSTHIYGTNNVLNSAISESKKYMEEREKQEEREAEKRKIKKEFKKELQKLAHPSENQEYSENENNNQERPNYSKKREKKNGLLKNRSRNKKSKRHSSRFLLKHKKKIIIVIIALIIIGGVMFAIQANKWKTIVQAMATQKNSVILDTDQKEIAKVGEQKKKIVKTGEQIPKNLKNAYVAIEDERFYEHGGVDLKRTVAAIGSYLIHFGSSDYGGSTITQQLVKNITGDNQGSVSRKITEWFRASQIETFMSKDEVLEFYLNVIYTGPSIYGVGAGSKYYFNKDVSKLSLAECAFLAGINNSPNSYNPFSNGKGDLIKKRTNTVLDKMKELGYIDETECNTAKQQVESGLNFTKGTVESGDGVFSYHSDSVINEAIADIEKKYDITDTFATNYIEMAGLKIYSTVDSKVQNEVESECKKSKYKITSNGESSQAAMVVIEPSTGNVVACVGGLGEKTKARSLNRATQSLRQTGSSIKPLSVLVPAISKNIINPTTICDDTQRDFGNGYAPRDFSKQLGKVTVRRALESSQNIPFVEIMEKVTPNTAMDYLKKMGITSLTEKDRNLGLALGGQEKGITPLQMAGAYNTIANDGEYIEPTFYTKIVDSNNNEVVKTSQKKRRVISRSEAFIIKQLLTQPVQGTYGTANYCKISGVDVAAKTGTTDEDYDRWLCGFTPYYTAACWFGYDQNRTVHFNNRNPAGLIWANAMSRIHSGKTSKKFEMPTGWFENVVSYRVCSESGKLARTNCEHTYTEYYLSNNVPGYCDMHSGSESGKISNSTDGIKSTVNEIIQSITNEIDAIDPQEIEKTTQNIISPFIDTNQNNKDENTTKTNQNSSGTSSSSNSKSNDNKSSNIQNKTSTNTEVDQNSNRQTTPTPTPSITQKNKENEVDTSTQEAVNQTSE
ncbi:MAG: penicillin-binding protein [Clostridia bacterium]|nr:penicillin-binding protein [Clostridia bacterium]